MIGNNDMKITIVSTENINLNHSYLCLVLYFINLFKLISVHFYLFISLFTFNTL